MVVMCLDFNMLNKCVIHSTYSYTCCSTTDPHRACRVGGHAAPPPTPTGHAELVDTLFRHL